MQCSVLAHAQVHRDWQLVASWVSYFSRFLPSGIEVPGIGKGILYGSLPFPVIVVGSLKRRLWVKGPVGSLKNHCFYFIDAEAEDQ